MLLRRLIFSIAAGSAFAAASSTAALGEELASTESLNSGIDTEYFSDDLKPGNDFYGFVNQGWLDAVDIPADRADYGTFSILNDRAQEQIRSLIEAAAEENAAEGTDAQKIGDFYNSFTNLATRNAAGIETLRPLLDQVAAVETTEQLSEVMGTLLRNGVAAPFVAYISQDARRSDQYAVHFYQTGITLPDRDYYLEDDERYQTLRKQLGEYMSEMLAVVGVDEAEKAAKALVALETEIARIHWTNVENRDPVGTYNKVTFDELTTLFSGFPIEPYLNAAGVGGQESYIVRQPTYLKSLGALLQETPLEVCKQYLQFQLIDAYASMATAELEKRHFAFHATAIVGVEEQQPLWKRAVRATEGSLGEVLGRLYVEKHFSPKAKERMEELVENLKKAFAIRIEQLDWMSEGTKKQALEKLGKFNTKIGYPDRWKDYSKLSIDAEDLLGNVLRSANVEYQRDVDKLGGPIDRNEWGMTPQTINAYYNPVMNEIVFPAAILQPPFFNLEADDAANYGGIGAVIGHEISHGFDDKGSQYDGSGNLRNWWSKADREVFDKRAKQLVEQYSQYSPIEGMNVNGDLTLGENIGDLGGLAVALEAYQLSLDGKPAPVIDGMTGLQRFFYGWSQVWRRKYREKELQRRLLTDPHSPSQYRCNGIVSNMDAFYEAFEVGPDSAMYIKPEDRVRIW